MNPAFRFARGGKVYKELEAEEAHQIAGYIRTGIIGANDDYWMPGMADWKKVSTRQWDFPKPADESSAPKLNIQRSVPTQATPTPTPSSASNPTTLQSFSQSAHSHECTACMKGFNEPAKSPSGYSVIGKAVKFFLLSLLAHIVLGVISYGYYSFNLYRDTTTPPSKITAIIIALIVLLLGILAIGLLLMSLFELIASSVTHGLFRFNPERCPHCKSPTFVKKF
jgi:transposase-like protein